MNSSNRFQKQLNQAAQSAQQAVLQAERAQEMLDQALSIGHPGDIQFAQAKLKDALDKILQVQSYTGQYINVDQQFSLQQAELGLRQAYQNLQENDISDLADRIIDVD